MVPPLALTFGLATMTLLALVGLGLLLPFYARCGAGRRHQHRRVRRSLLGGWRAVGRTILPLGTLLRVPLYIMWKLPIYLKLVRGGADRRWTRTERD